jgi:hypothetical protein
MDELACPSCGKQVNLALSHQELKRDPRPEDASVCGYCGEILVFTPSMDLRRMKSDELFTDYEAVADQILEFQFMVRSRKRK